MNESGGHRIQRIPPTERKGRVHTSTVTVAITDPSVPDFEMSDADIKVEWYSGTGKGGQNRNKTQNCCRLTYLPTKVIVTAQCRDRLASYTQAYAALTERVIQSKLDSYVKMTSVDRKLQVGSGQRGDKIRTYRFQDDSVCDHVTGKICKASRALKGHIDLLW